MAKSIKRLSRKYKPRDPKQGVSWYLWLNHFTGTRLSANWKIPQFSVFKIVRVAKTEEELFKR